MMKETLVTTVQAESIWQGRALCFTSNRLIIANVDGTRLIYAFFILAALGGLIIVLLQGRARTKKTELLKDLSPEMILAADKKNFAIPYTELGKVEMYKKMRQRKIRITDDTAKYEFSLSKSKEFEDYVTVLSPLLNDKLVVS
ncbi:hypothetical protein ACFLW2_02780 [Chloroflexota bacterium]